MNISSKMPPRSFYRKKTTYRRKPYRKPNAKKSMMGHRTTGLKYGAALSRQVKLLASMCYPEKKFYDKVYSVSVSNNGGDIVPINDMSPGTGPSDRIGLKVTNAYVHIRYTAKINASATNTLLKMVLYCDKKPDASGGSPPTLVDIYGTSPTVQSQIDLSRGSGDRFVILRQRTIKLNSGSGLSATGDMYVNLKQTVTKYDTDGLAFEGNAIYIGFISDESVNTPLYSHTSRITYYDS